MNTYDSPVSFKICIWMCNSLSIGVQKYVRCCVISWQMLYSSRNVTVWTTIFSNYWSTTRILFFVCSYTSLWGILRSYGDVKIPIEKNYYGVMFCYNTWNKKISMIYLESINVNVSKVLEVQRKSIYPLECTPLYGWNMPIRRKILFSQSI